MLRCQWSNQVSVWSDTECDTLHTPRNLEDVKSKHRSFFHYFCSNENLIYIKFNRPIESQYYNKFNSKRIWAMNSVENRQKSKEIDHPQININQKQKKTIRTMKKQSFSKCYHSFWEWSMSFLKPFCCTVKWIIGSNEISFCTNSNKTKQSWRRKDLDEVLDSFTLAIDSCPTID